ncbi:MAG: hypothetical protein KIT84_43040 [Labilithrix sp.]|nr:hypothetical protein [Labilithrix sp.]MCW5817856.1 hypothetical protein [Labilithrix sp.]
MKWLADNPSSDSVAALGRLADTDEKARAALEVRAAKGDVNAFLAAWTAVTRDAEWGTTFLRTSLADPLRAEGVATALPRKDLRLVPFIVDIENAVVRLSAGHRGSTVLSSLLASLGVPAHAAIERRLVDAKTRGAMCEAIATPEASGDAKSALLAVPSEARDHAACVTAVIDIAATENVVVDWLAISAEPGLLSVAAKSALPCPRVVAIWNKALAERPPESQPALAVPLKNSIARCGTALDPVLGELLGKAPRARATIVQAIDPFGAELAAMKQTCSALRSGAARNESAVVRERAEDALARGCAL